MMNSSPASSWDDVLTTHHLTALPQTSFVPVDAWLVDQRAPTRLLHLVARGTRVRLSVHDRSDLTTMLVRAECDCEEHRLAGAAGRLTLRPGAAPLAETVFDGAARAGWTGIAAGRLRPDEVAPVLAELLAAVARDSPLSAAV
jgi:hypothetical protein